MAAVSATAVESLLDLFDSDELVLAELRKEWPEIADATVGGWVHLHYANPAAFERALTRGLFHALGLLGDRVKIALPGRTFYFPNGLTQTDARRLLRDIKDHDGLG